MFGQAGGLDQLHALHAADRHRAADVEVAVLLLAVDAHVVAPVAAGQLLARRHQVEAGPPGQLVAEALGPELLDQVAHPGQAAVLAVAELAEELGDGPGDLDRLVLGHEHVDVGGHPLAVGQPAAHQEVEPERAVGGPGRPQADVVDLGLGAVLEAARHRDLELAGQVGVLAVAGEEVGDGPGDGQGVEGLVGVDARDRAAQHVAGRVAAGLDGGQADRGEPAPDPGDVLDPQPVDLDGLAGGEVGVAGPEHARLGAVGTLAEGVGDHADLAGLGGGEEAAGHLDPHHEGVAALLLGVDAGPLQALDLAGHLGDAGRTLLRVRVDDGVGDLEGVALELEQLDLVQLTRLAVRVDERHGPVRPAQVQPVQLVPVLGHLNVRSCQTWSPHSTLSESAHRPARRSSPSATGRVVGAQPMDT